MWIFGSKGPSGFSGRSTAEEVTEGIDGTDIKAGLIGEIGCSWPLTQNERKVLRAAARAQTRCGCALMVHPGRNVRAPMEVHEESKGERELSDVTWRASAYNAQFIERPERSERNAQGVRVPKQARVLRGGLAAPCCDKRKERVAEV